MPFAPDLQRLWDRCAPPGHPFVTRGFFEALLTSGSATPDTGWTLRPIAVEGAMAPFFLKTHSYGEYVFDHTWAQAWQRAGNRYFPKGFVGVPFSPVPGPRLLVAPDAPVDARSKLISALEVASARLSSTHVTFITEVDRAAFASAGWVIRQGFQFHFHNPGYSDFEAYLSTLSSHRRKDTRRERRLAQACGLKLGMYHDVSPTVWAQFHGLYVANTDKKWGQAYLEPSFFSRLAEALPGRVWLAGAFDGETLVAGALHLLGDDCLYGRNWGSIRDVPFLHFELCYYMAIEFALQRGLARVEAGAQGEHKLQRGYLPTPTWSAHFVPDPRFRTAVQRFCNEEQAALEGMLEGVRGPYREQG